MAKRSGPADEPEQPRDARPKGSTRGTGKAQPTGSGDSAKTVAAAAVDAGKAAAVAGKAGAREAAANAAAAAAGAQAAGARAAGAAAAATSAAATSAARSDPDAPARPGAGGKPDAGTSTAGPSVRPVSDEEIDRLVGGAHHDPHSVLGPHPFGGAVTVRVLRPDAQSVTLVTGTERLAMTHERAGIWFVVWPGPDVPDYRVDVDYGGTTIPGDDPYRFLPTLGEMDLHLLGEGRHENLWQVLGAHVHSYRTLMGTVEGVSFAVWAPNAQGIRVVGDFNYWDGRAHPMRTLGSSGIWELFVPDIGPGNHYKFQILGADSRWREKSDPMAFATEVPPRNASVVYRSTFEWNDADWLAKRSAGRQLTEPMSVYEVHVGSWKQGMSYRELADDLVEYVTKTGFTHVEFLPVSEHPFGGSWGYQVSSYFAPTARFGEPDDFRHLVDRLHQAGIGVLVDWVPGHFPKDAWALGRFDGTALYEHPDPRRGEQPDWGTLVFDFGRREVRNFLVANALFWLEEFHVDGLRVDAVASMLYLDYSREPGEWVPNIYGGNENLEAVAFLQEMNATVYRRVPGACTIAEESTSWPGVSRPTYLGGLGFGFKWNMGWMHDTLSYASRDPVFRSYHHHQMTFSMMYAYSENFVLPISHDEVVYGKGSLLRKMPGDRWQQLANMRALLAYMWAHPGKQLLFMGSEFGQEAEWAENRSLDWYLLDLSDHRGLWDLVCDLNRTYKRSSALWSQDYDPHGFSWIDADDVGNNTFTFLRFGADGSALACVANFSGVPHGDYRLGLPRAGRWTELLNTDAVAYGGSGVGNLGGVDAEATSWHGQPASAVITVPPLATVWFSAPPAEAPA